ncbi:MAG: hypothetical protein GY822_22560 [Deltaproteobacteria bacterium]|nr:hypothetical protein [Deltaproteobacteria bacterium]
MFFRTEFRCNLQQTNLKTLPVAPSEIEGFAFCFTLVGSAPSTASDSESERAASLEAP